MNIDQHFLSTIIFAFVSGVIPALIWLFFWSYEDRENPEPKSMLALAFVGGMIAVFISLFLEKYLYGFGLKNLLSNNIFKEVLTLFNLVSSQTGVNIDRVLLVVLFAPFIEETAKFLMAYTLVLRSSADDEPLDPMIYMITTALGFAAIENMLFLISPFNSGDLVLTVFTGNMRFIGAMLLHTVSSAVIGMFISFHFFDKKAKRMLFIILGLTVAIIMHSIFNLLMIGNQSTSIFALELIWIAVIIILLAFEMIKKIKKEKTASPY